MDIPALNTKDRKKLETLVSVYEALQGLSPVEKTSVMLTVATLQFKEGKVPLDVAKAATNVFMSQLYEKL